MAIALSDMRAQVRSELGVSETELPDALILDYVNLVQIEVAQMLGPVASPGLRKRSAALLGAYSEILASDDATGTYTDSTSVLTNFTIAAASANYYAGDEVVFTNGTLSYKDIVVSNTGAAGAGAATVTTAGNCQSGDLATVTACILHNPKAIDPYTVGVALPIHTDNDDCMTPLYLSDSTTPSSENRIDVVQIDDLEQYFQNEYWDAETVGAFQVGPVMHVMKGDSATFDTTVVMTYVRRPTKFSSDTHQLKISEGRLPEEYWGIIRAGILKMAAMHLHRREDMIMQGDDMTARVAAIQRSFSMSDAVRQEEKVTQ